MQRTPETEAMKPAGSLTMVPYAHGRLAFTQHVRDVCLRAKFDCIAVDLPYCLQEFLLDAVHDLPYISAVVGCDGDGIAYFAAADPCDAAIEALRQSRQNHVPCHCVGGPALSGRSFLPPLPDDFALSSLGFDAYVSLCVLAVNASLFPDGKGPELQPEAEASCIYTAQRLLELSSRYKNVLSLVHLGHFSRVLHHFRREQTWNFAFDDAREYSLCREFVNPDHLYFALGELPFITGRFERERYDPFSPRINVLECIKGLFTETRDDWSESSGGQPSLSPGRIQRGLSFLRNLSLQDGRFIPNLPDIVTAAKGVGGNSFALKILANAKYYPYLPFELEAPLLSLGIDKVHLPSEDAPRLSVNLLRDVSLAWRTLPLRPDPSRLASRRYRFAWNPLSSCSHVPEDERIERFNAHLRAKTHKIMAEDGAVSEKFTVSVKDGIDIRETMRNWFTGDVYVRELPPSRGKVDTVVIIFDAEHDEKYPHCATWYAEHVEESTLTFYATDPLADLIGPGIARSYYGGLSLLFPPRMIPDVFSLPGLSDLRTRAEVLTYGGLLFSREKTVAYVAAKKPGVRLCGLARKLGKRLLWLPLSAFSTETLYKLRKFHVLNGKTVRGWAARFIGE
jgi:hypothetical protein